MEELKGRDHETMIAIRDTRSLMPSPGVPFLKFSMEMVVAYYNLSMGKSY
jgi:hypothetical protein